MSTPGPTKAVTNKEYRKQMKQLAPAVNKFFAPYTCEDLTVGFSIVGQGPAFVRGKEGKLVPLKQEDENPVHTWMVMYSHSMKTGMRLWGPKEEPDPEEWMEELEEARRKMEEEESSGEESSGEESSGEESYEEKSSEEESSGEEDDDDESSDREGTE